MKKCDKILKNIQRKLLDFIQTRQGLTLLCISLLLIVIFTLQLSETILEYHFFKPKCAIQSNQIDVVYTWVNGSDPNHQRLVNKYKLNEIKMNLTQIEIGQLGAVNTSYCHYKFCIAPNNLIVISPKLSRVDKQHFLLKSKILLEHTFYSNITIDSYLTVLHSKECHSNIHYTNNISLIHLNNYDFIRNRSLINQLSELFKITFLNKPYKYYVGYYTINCDLSPNCVRLNRTFMAKRFRESIRNRDYLSFNTLPQSKLDLPSFLKENTIFENEYEHEPELVFDPSVEIKNKVSKKNTLKLKIFKVRSKEAEMFVHNRTNMVNSDLDLDFYPLYLVWDLGNQLMDDFSKNRFEDNNELKYSLRSVEKYAPWIRNVYIVTNGQVPNWLNTSHPRIKLVNHSDIFEDKSHLPTFSSNAIESNLHRIKGLSEKFLYFNDDVLLGREIYLDDFYTESRGFKFHLAWQLPGCNPNCPNSWIKDGYCDKACNTTECEYDGGDCISANMDRSGRQSFLNQSHLITSEFYCSSGCSNSWLADKYCDHPCNNPACAYDMGDCGLEGLKELYQIKVDKLSDQLTVNSPKQVKAFYLNFTFDEFRFIKAEYSENTAVRSVSAVNKFKCLIVLLVSEPANFEIILDYSLRNKTQKSKIFIKAGTFILQPETTTHLPKKNLNLTNIQPVKLELKSMKDYSVNKTYNIELFDKLHKNYMDFLIWSVNNQLLTEQGRLYKIGYFNQRMSELITLYANDSDPVNYVYSFIFADQFTDKNMLKQYVKDQNLNENNLIKIFHKRKLLDTFADSLKNVNKLYNQIYGFVVRKVPAHMPHFIHTKLMNKLNEKFKINFTQTSSHRFRHESDMQYAFSYYYYVMGESEPMNASVLFDELDSNKNGFLDQMDIKLLNLRLSTRNFDANDFEMNRIRSDFQLLLEKCENKSDFSLSKKKFLSCDDLVDFLGEKFWPGLPSDEKQKRWKYKFETVGDEDTKFIMISGNEHDLEVKLNNLVRSPRKFICLNDNIDYKLENEARRLKNLIRNFYELLFPIPSSFELTGPLEPQKLIDQNNSFILLIVISFCVFILVCCVKSFCFDNDKVTRYRREYRVSAALRRRMKKTKTETSSLSTSSEDESQLSSSFKKNFGIFVRSKFKRIRKTKATLDNI